MSALYGFTSLKQQDLNSKGTISRIRWEFELASSSRAAALEHSGHEMDMEIEMEEQPEREQVRIRFFDKGQIPQSTGLSN